MMVSKSSLQTETTVEAFLESHFFDGGRKVRPYMLTAQRPDWAPSAEWVGFEHDFKLHEGEKVVEFAKFAINSSLVCWIAVWVKSTDRTFGDRQNYEGLGIWLRDVVITSPGPLIESLDRLGSLIGRDSDSDLADKSVIFLQDGYPGRYAQHCEGLPQNLSGWRNATAPGSAKKNYAVAASASESLVLISDLILSAQFMNKPGDDHSRCFIWVSPDAKSNPGDRAGSATELLTSAGFAGGIASLLPQAFRSINCDLEALKESEKDGRKQIAKLLDQIEKQGEDNRKMQLQLSTAEDRAASFELALSKDGEQQRFVKLFDAVADVKLRIAEQSGMESRLSSEIRRSLRLELAPISELDRRIDALMRGVCSHRSPDAIYEKPKSVERNTLDRKYSFYFVLAIVFGVALSLMAMLFR